MTRRVDFEKWGAPKTAKTLGPPVCEFLKNVLGEGTRLRGKKLSAYTPILLFTSDVSCNAVFRGASVQADIESMLCSKHGRNKWTLRSLKRRGAHFT